MKNSIANIRVWKFHQMACMVWGCEGEEVKGCKSTSLQSLSPEQLFTWMSFHLSTISLISALVPSHLCTLLPFIWVPFHLCTLSPKHPFTCVPFHLCTLPHTLHLRLPESCVPFHLSTLPPFHLCALPPFHLCFLLSFHMHPPTLSPVCPLTLSPEMTLTSHHF